MEDPAANGIMGAGSDPFLARFPGWRQTTTMRKAAMNSTLRKFAQAGFTLVELLIVVIILAILAAIVIPQFTSTTTDAQESALDSNLSSPPPGPPLFQGPQHGGYY